VGKWFLLFLLMVIALGVWMAVDPGARPAITAAWRGITNGLGGNLSGIDASSLWAPVVHAFQKFANSVASMWSPTTIHINVPSIQVQP
jgi:hypothetical protein